jgi:hypothetical protein
MDDRPSLGLFRRLSPFPSAHSVAERSPGSRSRRCPLRVAGIIIEETGMPMQSMSAEHPRFEIGRTHQELALYIEGHVNRVSNGRIRDLRVVYSDDRIVLEGRSRTYHAKQLAHQAVLDLTDGHPLLANLIVVF